MFVRAFRNLGPEIVSGHKDLLRTILGLVRGTALTTRTVQMDSIRVLQDVLVAGTVSEDISRTLMTLFIDPKADISVRSMSVEALLRATPSQALFRDVLALLRWSKASELRSLCISRMMEFAQSDQHINALVR